MYRYHSERLDSPPPPSLFRRPWSPVELESYSHSTAQGLRRQPSLDTSVEVLDLEEYSRMASGNTGWDRPSYPEYPATPPRSFSLASRGSIPASPPTLASGVSSASHSQSARLYTPPPSQRPPALAPPRTFHSSPAINSGHSHNYPWLAGSNDFTDYQQNKEVDISNFPKWSRNWYSDDKMVNPRLDPYTPISTFDPALVSSLYDELGNVPQARPYASTNESHRDLLPWSFDDDNTSKRVTSEMKEERMRMLEQEFGRDGRKHETWYPGSKVIGSVNAKGKIITPGPKKRAIVRWMQGTFALGATIASLYSALILKPVGNPPPKGTVSAYLLYILSIITISLMVYIFVIRPCCCSGKRNRKATQQGAGGMVALPIQQLPGAQNTKKGKKKEKKNAAGGVFVNLIVDPTMFRSLGRDEDGTDDGEAETSAERRGGRRRGLFEGLAMEEQWREARKHLKRVLLFDITLTFLWGVEFVVILLGKRCPVGKFDGWCDGYNVATALAIFLSVSFGFSVFFDVKDLHLSKASPRTRT